MIVYVLVSGGTRIRCGRTKPVYVHRRRGWETDAGLVSAWDESMFSLDQEEDGEPEPTPTPKPTGPRHITRLAFRNRFTQAEKVTLEIAALDDPAAAMVVRQQAAALRASMKDQENATYIDLDRADTRAGVIALETAGLLGVDRALAILDAEVQPEEVFHG